MLSHICCGTLAPPPTSPFSPLGVAVSPLGVPVTGAQKRGGGVRSDVLEEGEGGGGLKRGGGGGLAGTPLLLGCPSTFSTFIMSCEKWRGIFSFSVPACQMIPA